MATGIEPAGVMVVRIWLERSDGSLRARLTHTLDVAGGEETSHAAATIDEILAGVHDWVAAFLEQANIQAR